MTASVPAEFGLYEWVLFTAAHWRRLVGITAVTVAGAVVSLLLSPRPSTTTVTLRLTPAPFAEMIVASLDWRLLPEGLMDGIDTVRIERARAGGFVRLTVETAQADPATPDRVLAWIVAQPAPLLAPLSAIPSEPEPPEPAAYVVAPAPPPSSEMMAAWRTELQRLERLLPTLSATAAVYWTTRALALHGQIEAGEAAGRDWPAKRAAFEAATAAARWKVRPRPVITGAPAPAPVIEPERAVVVARGPARPAPRRWVMVLGTAAAGGFVLAGFFPLCVEAWWRAERAARGGPHAA